MAWTDAKVEFVDSDLQRQFQFPTEFLVRLAIGGVPDLRSQLQDSGLRKMLDVDRNQTNR